MSLKRMLDTLVGLGFTRTEAQVYVFLAKIGPRREKELASALKLTQRQLHRNLENLRAKGIVNATSEPRALYSAVSIRTVLSHFTKAKTEQAKALQANRDELLSFWRTATEADSAKNQKHAPKNQPETR